LGIIEKIKILEDKLNFENFSWMKSWVKLKNKNKVYRSIKGQIEKIQNQTKDLSSDQSLRFNWGLN